MKRVKLILTAIAAIGIVGGALGFKAKGFGDAKYCYTTTTAAGASCILTVNNAGFFGSLPLMKYVTIPSSEDCSPGRVCTKVAFAIED